MTQQDIGKPVPKLRKIRLILVEDYKLVRVGLRMALSLDEEIEVIGEGNCGLQGLHLVQTLKPNLVILDLGLPDMDGFEVTREIRRIDQDVRILVLTSHERDEEVIRALSYGANAFCMKDIASDRLVEVVKSVFDGAIWLDPRVAPGALRIFSEGASRRRLHARLALSDRERAVLRLIAEGMSNPQIARKLEMTLHSSKVHVGNILQKLCVEDRTQAAVKAIQQSLI